MQVCFRLKILLRLAVGVACFVPYFVLTAGEDLVNGSRECRYFWWVKDTVHKYRIYRQLWKCKNPVTGVSGDGLPSGALGVYVIGESATRGHMSAYGYGRKTTPELERLVAEAEGRDERIFLFEQVFASSLYTVDAVRLLLSNSTLERAEVDYSLSGVCRAGGYRIVAATAQGHWGRWKNFENYEMLVMGPSDRRVCLHDTGGRYDGELLPELRAAMVRESTKGPVAAFVHLEGSHDPFYDKYPPAFGTAKLSEWGVAKPGKIDFYDVSLAYTDAVLGELVEFLRAQKCPAFLVYISDHGECPGTGSMRRPDESSCWEIPMVVWMSRAYRERCGAKLIGQLERVKKTKLQPDQMFGGLAALAGLRKEGEPSFWDKGFKPRERLIMLKESKLVEMK